MTTYYIAGPMRGHDCFNFPAFDACAEDIRAGGNEAINPAEHDREQGFDETLNSLDGFDLKAALLWDLEQIALHADAVALLRGWEKSSGVAAELAVARALGKPVYTYEYDEDLGCGIMRSLRSDRIPSTEHNFDAAEPTSPCDTSCVNFGKCYMDGCAERGVNHDGVYYESGEVRVTDPTTGGQKGSKLARFDLIPSGALWQLAEHYGRGAQKYDEDNWRRGYSWRLSFAALMRHAWSFWNGEDVDEETGSSHMVAVAWHAFTLLTFITEGLGTDDRQVKA